MTGSQEGEMSPRNGSLIKLDRVGKTFYTD